MDLIALLFPADIGPVTAAALLFASFTGSFITIAFGIGGGVLLLAVMASLMPPLALIPVHGVIQLGSNAGRAAFLWRQIHRPALTWFALGAVAGTAVGASLSINISPALVQVGVGLFVIWSVLARPPAWLRRYPLIAGAFSSVLTMFFGATGPFVATYVKAMNLTRHGHAATHATLMVLQHSLKTVAFALIGFAFAPWIGFIAAMIAAGLAGTWTGRHVLNRLSDLHFHRALNVILLLLAARLIWAGVTMLAA